MGNKVKVFFDLKGNKFDRLAILILLYGIMIGSFVGIKQSNDLLPIMGYGLLGLVLVYPLYLFLQGLSDLFEEVKKHKINKK